MTFDEYLKIRDRVNFSTLKAMRRSPLHYLHALRQPVPDRKVLAMGRAAHTAILDPDRFPLDYAVFRGARRSGTDWEAFKEQHKDQTILKVDEYEKSLEIRDAVMRHPIAAKYLSSGRAEQSLQWTEVTTGLACKARLDWCNLDLSTLVDLKTTRDVDERLFATVVARLGYHIQLAMYADGLHRLTGGDWKAVIIAVENEAPYDVAVFRIDADVMHAGREAYLELMRRVDGCRRAAHWPGRHQIEHSLELPTWAVPQDEEVDAPSFDDVEITTGAGL